MGTRTHISTTARPASPAREWAIIAIGLLWIAACAAFDSLKPALRDSDAIEMPGVVGSWRSPDTTLLTVVEIRQVGQRPPEYLITSEDADEDTTSTCMATNGGAREICPAKTNVPDSEHRTRRTSFDVRVGRLGGRLVAEFTPSTRGDSVLRRAVYPYAPQIWLTYTVVVLKLSGDSLQLFLIRADSAYSALQRGLCLGPFIANTETLGTPSIWLAGTSDEVRNSYDCLLRRPGIVGDSAALRRIAPH